MVKRYATTIETMVENIENRLRAAMRFASMEVAALAAKSGVSYQGIRKHADGMTQTMSAGTAAKLAKALGVDKHWLALGEGEMAPASRPPGIIDAGAAKVWRVYVVGKGTGGIPERIWTDGDYPVNATDSYAEIATADQHAFLTEVDGSSMVPRYNPGEFALVEPSTEPELEDDVLVRLSTGQTMIKRLLSRRDGWRFGSYNAAETLYFQVDEVSWVYYVAHPVPRRKIKSRH